MDNFGFHLSPYQRRFPMGLQASSVGYAAVKKDWVNGTFSGFNFSFIISGRGKYIVDGREYEVHAPCVITQHPDSHYQYGGLDTWEELFVIYPIALLNMAKGRGLDPYDKEIWHIRDSGFLRQALVDLKEMANKLNESGVPDRIDRLLEGLIVEARLRESHPRRSPLEQAVIDIRAVIDTDFLKEVDFDQMAFDRGVRPFSLRRVWRNIVGVAPYQYQIQLKMRHACRRLIESNDSVARIARELKFEDTLYFSRLFKKVMTITATDYRKEYCNPYWLRNE